MRPNRVFLVALFAATCLAMLSFAQQKPDTSAKITALESKWCDAYKQRDVATMSSLLADDFIITVEDGNTYGKAGYIAHSGDSQHVSGACRNGGTSSSGSRQRRHRHRGVSRKG